MPARALPLLSQLQSPQIDVIARGDSDENLPAFDLHLPMLSLPMTLGRFAPEPLGVPYLSAGPELRARWRARLGDGGELRVGLAWKGNPQHKDDRWRSIPPAKLSPLLSVPGIRFVSLQVQPRAPLPPGLAAAGVVDYISEIQDFSDSAALMAELDLIISSDTGTVHLAGALGRPVWVMLQSMPDWRWGLCRDDTPWYPTMRLFRQTTADDWDAVAERVAAALREWRDDRRPANHE